MKPVKDRPSAEKWESITTLVVDDSPSFLHGFCHYLRTEPGMAIVATATTGFEAIDLVRRMRPKLVVMDLHLPGLRGDHAAVWIAEHFPEIHVLVVSSDPRPSISISTGRETCAFMCKNDLLFEFTPLLARWFPREEGRVAEPTLPAYDRRVHPPARAARKSG
jgi:CheY-like chemotaxis protein